MDIDIDFPSTFDPIDIFSQITKASMVKDKKLIKHPAGVYFQNIPVDCVTSLSAIPYEDAEQLGYTKIDFLHLSVLDCFNNKDELRKLLKKEPNWSLLQSKTVVDKLFQISKHFELIQTIKPRSVEELADCIALIRPGKRYLLQEYNTTDRITFRKKLYKKTEGYYYKKGHAISYALTIVLQIHLIQSGVL